MRRHRRMAVLVAEASSIISMPPGEIDRQAKLIKVIDEPLVPVFRKTNVVIAKGHVLCVCHFQPLVL